jgi:hypothetical protein
MAPELDTCGLLARDPILWATACQALYRENITMSNSYPTEILTLGFPTNATDDGSTLLINFVNAVAKFLDANITVFNDTESWLETSGISVPVTEFMNLTYPVLISQHEISAVRDPFYADYAKVHDGRLPFIDPVPLARWAFGASTSATIAEAVANKTTYMDWFETQVLVADNDTCSDKILMYVGSDATLVYRNQYLSPPTPPFGYYTSTISIFSEAPDFVVPSKSSPKLEERLI